MPHGAQESTGIETTASGVDATCVDLGLALWSAVRLRESTTTKLLERHYRPVLVNVRILFYNLMTLNGNMRVIHKHNYVLRVIIVSLYRRPVRIDRF